MFESAGVVPSFTKRGTAYERSDFMPDAVPTYAPPEQRDVDVVTGLDYYTRVRGSVSNEEFEKVLDWMTSLFGPYFQTASQRTIAEAVEDLDPTRSPGFYWRRVRGSTKGDVMSSIAKSLGLGLRPEVGTEAREEWNHRVGDYLLQFFRHQWPVFSSTLKDELRPIGKGPRLFMAGPIESSFAGNWLFGGQNDSLMRHLFGHPVMMGVDMPGPGQTSIFSRLRDFNGDRVVAFDATKWDASVPMWLFALCAALRKKFLDASVHDDVDRYYAGVYKGWVEANGEIIRVYGQRSGQTLTAADNSLALTALMCLHGIRSGISYAVFRRNVLMFAMGDDLIYSTNLDEYEVQPVAKTFRMNGVYLENDQPYGRSGPIETASFLGCTPAWREYPSGSGVRVLLPRFRVERFMSSLLWFRSKTDTVMHWSKLVAVTILMFAEKDLFEVYRERVNAWYTSHSEELYNAGQDETVSALFAFLNSDARIFALFTGLEGQGSDCVASVLAGAIRYC